jgi:transposase
MPTERSFDPRPSVPFLCQDSALARWYHRRTQNAPKARKTMIVALARKLLIALWRLVREGVVPEGVVMRPA